MLMQSRPPGNLRVTGRFLLAPCFPLLSPTDGGCHGSPLPLGELTPALVRHPQIEGVFLDRRGEVQQIRDLRDASARDLPLSR
jgi:hypothetical protein